MTAHLDLPLTDAAVLADLDRARRSAQAELKTAQTKLAAVALSLDEHGVPIGSDLRALTAAVGDLANQSGLLEALARVAAWQATDRQK